MYEKGKEEKEKKDSRKGKAGIEKRILRGSKRKKKGGDKKEGFQGTRE
jgi:hypothetical protein